MSKEIRDGYLIQIREEILKIIRVFCEKCNKEYEYYPETMNSYKLCCPECLNKIIVKID